MPRDDLETPTVVEFPQARPSNVDVARLDECPVYAKSILRDLASPLTINQLSHLNAAFDSKREGLLLDAERAWCDPFFGDRPWTDDMGLYHKALITLHLDRTRELSPIDHSVNLPRSTSLYPYLTARGE